MRIFQLVLVWPTFKNPEMKSIFVLLVFTFFTAVSCTQVILSKVQEQNKHINHQVFEENKLPPRATFFALESPEITDKGDSRRYLSYPPRTYTGRSSLGSPKRKVSFTI